MTPRNPLPASPIGWPEHLRDRSLIDRLWILLVDMEHEWKRDESRNIDDEHHLVVREFNTPVPEADCAALVQGCLEEGWVLTVEQKHHRYGPRSTRLILEPTVSEQKDTGK